MSSLISDETFIAVERPLIFRALDKPGQVSVIGGIPVGVIRLTSGLGGAIISGIGALFCCCSSKLYGKFTFSGKYLLDEASRGFTEIFCLVKHFDNQKENFEKEGTITDWGGAAGNYIYESPFPCGFMVYSKKNLSGKEVSWARRIDRNSVRGVYGNFRVNKEKNK